MATVTKTIGTSSRDYSDIDAWEADLDSDSIYSDGDTAIGECYADSTFSDVAYLIEQGTTIGGSAGYDLALIKLTVHADSRHDGTAGTGALLKSTANGTHDYGVLRINVDNVTVEWLEIDMDHDGDITTEDSDSRDMNKGIVLTGTNDDCIIRNKLIYFSLTYFYYHLWFFSRICQFSFNNFCFFFYYLFIEAIFVQS